MMSFANKPIKKKQFGLLFWKIVVFLHLNILVFNQNDKIC